MTNAQLKVLDNAIETYGEAHQLTKAIEELAELQKEVCKYLLKEGGLLSLEHLAEELADVIIMGTQIQLIYGKDFAAYVNSFIDAKIDRLEQKLKGSELLE